MPNLSKGFRIWLGRIAWGAAALIVAAMVSGALYQNVLLARERRAHPMPGELIDVGGYRMHIHCTGRGTPPVILDSGLGDSYISWQNVQLEIAKFVQVCSYDRAGMGYSEPSPRRRTSRVFAEELHRLLHGAGIAPPYVLVGHSMAGYNVRLYADLYRSEMAGMVLVDGSHPDQLKRFPPALHAMDANWIRQAKFLEFTAPIGIPRLFGYCGNDAALRAAECTFNDAHENAAERETFRESADEAKATGNLGQLPLVVISHDPDQRHPDVPDALDKATNKAWEQMQEELSRLSTRSTQLIAKRSGHYIQNDRPDIVIEAVHNIVDETRQ
jgi:pimeloyl-ACP methyl ester carboxylesterase